MSNRLLAAAAGLAVAATTICAGHTSEVGTALFDGGTEASLIEARVGPGNGVPVSASRFACRSCHGRDGRGSREGGSVVPKIDPATLAVSTVGRPAYDVFAFGTALREGIDPAGRQLAPLMPRYKVSDVEAAELLEYLRVISLRERTGVTTDSIRLGVPITVDAAFMAAFRRAWRMRGEPRLHGRRLVLEPIASVESDHVFALLFAFNALENFDQELNSSSNRSRALGAPVLFPVSALQGDENPEVVRGLFASRADQAAMLLRDLPREALLLADSSGRTLLENSIVTDVKPPIILLDELPNLPATSAILIMADSAGWRQFVATRQISPGTTLYGCLDDAASVVAELRQRGIGLVLADPRPARGSTGPMRPSRERFAATAAIVLETALAAAGRDLTRGALMRAFTTTTAEPPEWPALDYRQTPLTGSRNVSLLRLPPLER